MIDSQWLETVTAAVAPFDDDARYALEVSPPLSDGKVWIGWYCRSDRSEYGNAVFSVPQGPVEPAQWAERVRSDYERAASHSDFPKATVRS